MEKAKTLFGFNPSAMGDAVPAWKPSSPCFWSKGHSGAVGRAVGAAWLVGTPSNKLSKCVYIYLYIFISIYLSLSCSPRNRGRANSQARGPDGSSSLQGEGAPRGSLTHCPGLHKWFFS